VTEPVAEADNQPATGGPSSMFDEGGSSCVYSKAAPRPADIGDLDRGRPARSNMPVFLSVYFDLVRFGAAILVVLYHVWPMVAPDLPLTWPGHQAVIIFFVLSGYVIAHITESREPSVGAYALDRLSRLWSVVIPSLLIGAWRRHWWATFK